MPLFSKKKKELINAELDFSWPCIGVLGSHSILSSHKMTTEDASEHLLRELKNKKASVDVQVVRRLLDNAADVNCSDSRHQKSPLHWAVESSAREVLIK